MVQPLLPSRFRPNANNVPTFTAVLSLSNLNHEERWALSTIGRGMFTWKMIALSADTTTHVRVLFYFLLLFSLSAFG